MDNDSKSGSALNGVVNKIDFAKLKGTPEDFYKAGFAFIENGQFDDGILEFVKVVKTASIDAPSFGQAVKELKGMGFSGADISAITNIAESEIDLNTEMEIQSTNDLVFVQPPKEEMVWLFLLMLTSALLGVVILGSLGALIGLSGLYHIPGAGFIGGAVGGIAAGIIQVFSWMISKTIKVVLSIAAVIILLSILFNLYFFLAWVILLIPALIVFFITIGVCSQLKKPPVNWWSFGLILVVGATISITVTLLFSFFAAGFMAQ